MNPRQVSVGLREQKNTAALRLTLLLLSVPPLVLGPGIGRTQIEPPGTFVAIDANYGTCVLSTSGRIHCFNASGDGVSDYSITPAPVHGINTARSVSVGVPNCAVLADTTVRCWGTSAQPRGLPVTVPGLSGVTSVAAGWGHTCASRLDGTVWCWGNNSWGELGDGTLQGSDVPVRASGITAATKVVAGDDHTCALTAGGSVKCWGLYGSFVASRPVAIPGLGKATDIAAGTWHTCAVLADRHVACWGRNVIMTAGAINDSDIPVPVDGVDNVTGISSALGHNCALLANGTIKCWGVTNLYGQLGAGTREPSLVPVTVAHIQTATAVAAGATHSCAILADNTVLCWGAFPMIGSMVDPYFTGSLLPTPIRGLSYPVLRAEAVGDVNGNGLPDVAVLARDPESDVDRIVVKDRRGVIAAITVADSLPAAAMAVTPDQNGNGAPELAVLSAASLQARIHDSRTGALLRTLSFDAQSLPLAMTAVPAGEGDHSLALLAEWKGSLRAEILDARTGTSIGRAWFGSLADVQARDFASLADLDGNGSGELAVLLRNHRYVGRADKVSIRDGRTGQWLRNVWFGTGEEVRQLVVIPDSNGNGAPELGVLRNGDSRVAIRDSLTGAGVAIVQFNPFYVPQRLLAIPDTNGNGAAELALVGLRYLDGVVHAATKDLGTRQWLGAAWFGSREAVTTDDFLTVADIDGNGAVEVVRVGLRATDARSIADYRDPVTGAGSGHVEY